MSATATRLPDAAARLQDLLIARHDKPFAWGFRDCAMFAADVVHAVTGRDPAGDLRGTYFSRRQAARVLRQHGGLRGLASSRLGSEIAEHMASDGDVALLPTGPSSSGGSLVVVWRGALVGQGDNGLVLARTNEAVAFWSVSHG